MADIAVLTALIEPVVRDLGLELVRVQLTGAKGAPTLQVMAEDPATGQLTIDACADISRRLSDLFDELDPIESEYQLEVSSPGIDRPLTRPGDWIKWAGHDVRIKLTAPMDGRKHIHGAIGALEDDKVTIAVPGAGPVTVPLAAMQGAKLVLTNRLLNATRPLDATGAEDFEEMPELANDNDDED